MIVTTGGKEAMACSGWRPETLLNILYHTGQSPQQSDLAQMSTVPRLRNLLCELYEAIPKRQWGNDRGRGREKRLAKTKHRIQIHEFEKFRKGNQEAGGSKSL